VSDIDQLVNDILGERPKVKDTALRDMINARMKAGGAVVMKRGGRAKGKTLASMDTGKVEMRKGPGAEKAEKILSGAAEFIPFVGAGKAAAEGEYGSAAMQAGLDIAGGPLAKGLGAAIPVMAGIFIGPKSRLWNKEGQREWERLINAGVDEKEAYQKTGTFMGADGNLRQEISDQSMKMRSPEDLARLMDEKSRQAQAIKASMGYGSKQRDLFPKELTEARKRERPRLESLEADIRDLERDPEALGVPARLAVDHPKLFEAYPELGDVMVRQNVDLGPGVYGQVALGAEPKISLADPRLLNKEFSTPEDTMIHELQHLVQRAEGFEGGASAQDAINMVGRARVRELMDQGVPKNEALDQARTEFKGRAGELYNRMAGEAEARAVEARRPMSSEELLQNFPPEQQYRDFYPYEEQLMQRDYPPVLLYAKGGAVQAAPYGLRETSGMPKGKGYFGELPAADGVMTELSASDDAGDFPLIVPTLTREELEHLQSGGQPTEEIYAKAKAWAESRKGQGRDPFATSEDLRMPVPEYAKGGEVHAKDGGSDLKSLKRLTPFYGAKPAPVDAEEQEAKRRLRELEGRVLERDYIEPQKDDLEGMVRRGLRSGLGKVMSPEGSKRSADILTDVASFVAPPMWGYESGQALGRAYEAGRSGDYGEAALEGGLGVLGVLPAVPGIGVAARGAERAANIGSTALRRPFTPATLTVEATAPDLGQGTSYGFRQGLNDVLLQDIAAGRKAREGTGVFKSEITKRLETNPMLAVDIPRAGRIGEMAGSNEALRREIAQAGVDLNQEAMAAHRFIPLLTNRPEDASAMLIKTKGGLTGDEIVQLASRLGNEMVVTHNPRLGGVVIYPFGPVGKGGAPEFGVAKKAAQEILGKKGKIQYGVADYDKDRLFMEQVKGDYQRAGAKETSPEKAERRQKLQGLEKFMFPESTSGIPGNVKASPLGGLQPWSRGREYPTHVQGIGTKPDWRAVNYATEEVGQRRPTYAEAEKDREALLERWHRTLPGKVR